MSAEIPKSFKSTQDLLMQLGLREDAPRKSTTTHKTAPPLSSGLRGSKGRSASTPVFRETEYLSNVVVPDMTGITSLISGDTTTEMRKDTHKNIGSVPISDDDQGIYNSVIPYFIY